MGLQCLHPLLLEGPKAQVSGGEKQATTPSAHCLAARLQASHCPCEPQSPHLPSGHSGENWPLSTDMEAWKETRTSKLPGAITLCLIHTRCGSY